MLWFPPSYVSNSDFEHNRTSDVDYSVEDKRIWPSCSLQHVITVPYFVNQANWFAIGSPERKVKLRVVTENNPPYEEEILMKNINRF